MSFSSTGIYPLAQHLHGCISEGLRQWTGEPGDPIERDRLAEDVLVAVAEHVEIDAETTVHTIVIGEALSGLMTGWGCRCSTLDDMVDRAQGALMPPASAPWAGGNAAASALGDGAADPRRGDVGGVVSVGPAVPPARSRDQPRSAAAIGVARGGRRVMTWNYRVVHITHGEEESFAIYEVYYDDEGRPKARTEEPASPAGETFEELAEDLSYYQAALQEPVLEDAIFQPPTTGDLFGANES